MGIRQTLNENPSIATAVTIGVIILAFAFPYYGILWYIPPFDSVFSGGGGAVTELYYTVDDGKTTFVDKADRVVPFEHEGKQAVRATVFTCDENATTFVGYLERLSPQALEQYKQLQAKGENDPDVQQQMEMLFMSETQVKKPGTGDWVSVSSDQGAKIMDVKCPDESVYPRVVLPD